MANLDEIFGDCSDTVDGDGPMNVLKQNDNTPFMD